MRLIGKDSYTGEVKEGNASGIAYDTTLEEVIVLTVNAYITVGLVDKNELTSSQVNIINKTIVRMIQDDKRLIVNSSDVEQEVMKMHNVPVQVKIIHHSEKSPLYTHYKDNFFFVHVSELSKAKVDEYRYRLKIVYRDKKVLCSVNTRSYLILDYKEPLLWENLKMGALYYKENEENYLQLIVEKYGVLNSSNLLRFMKNSYVKLEGLLELEHQYV